MTAQPSPLDLLAAPRRQEILRLVWNRERAAGEIAGEMEVTFGAVSQHLKKLRQAGLVSRRKEGRHRLYRARRTELGPLADYLETLWAGRLETLRRLAEDEEESDGDE